MTNSSIKSMEETEMQQYYQAIEQAYSRAARDGKQFFLNKDKAHNSSVMRLMLSKSHNIRMFCGKMSVFRRSFYETGENQELFKEMQAQMESALEKFCLGGNELTVILEKYDEKIMDDLLARPALSAMAENGKLKIYKIKDDVFTELLNHFAVTDTNIFRIELDKTGHSAICSVADKETCKESQANFETLLTLSEQVAIRA